MPSYPNPALTFADGSPLPRASVAGYDRIVAADLALEAAGYGSFYEAVELTPEEHDSIMAVRRGEKPITPDMRDRLEMLSLFAEADRLWIPVQGSWWINARADYREEFRQMGYSQRWIDGNEQIDAESSVRLALRRILAGEIGPTH